MLQECGFGFEEEEETRWETAVQCNQRYSILAGCGLWARRGRTVLYLFGGWKGRSRAVSLWGGWSW